MKLFVLKLCFSLLLFFIFMTNTFAQSSVSIKYKDSKWEVENSSEIPNNKELTITFKYPKNEGYTFKYVNTSLGNTMVDLTPASDADKTNAVSVKVSANELGVLNNTLILKIYKNAAENGSIELPIKVVANGNDTSEGTLSDTKMPDVTGIAFFDAQALYNIGRSDTQAAIKILSSYKGENLAMNKDSITNAFADNIFLKEYINTLNVDSTIVQEHAGQKPVLRSIASSVGGIDVTKAANALSDIMIEHAKQELTIAFFRRFQALVEKHEEFRALFPKTADNLGNLLAYKYPEMLPTLRTGFLDDISKITIHIDDVLQLPKYAPFFKKFPEVQITLKSFHIFRKFENKAFNAADVIRELAAMKEWNNEELSNSMKNLRSSVKLSSVFSESLRETDKDKLWVSFEDLQTGLFSDEAVFKIYLGLVYEQCKNQKIIFTMKDSSEVSFSLLMTSNSDNLMLFQNKVEEFITLADKVSEVFTELKDRKKVTYSQSAQYIDLSIDVIEYGFDIVKLFDRKIDTKDYTSLFRNMNNLYKNIYSKQYNEAITHAFEIFTDIRQLIADHKPKIVNPDPTSEAGKLIVKLDKDKSEEAFNEAKAYYDAQSKSLEKQSKTQNVLVGIQELEQFNTAIHTLHKDALLKKFLDFIEKAKPYALFMANVVEAKSETDIKAALDNAILPVGSSTIKKYSDVNFAVQSYLGARFNSASANKSSAGTWGDNFGVSAPIGLSVSWGWGKKGSLSLFAPLLDLAAIVDYKLKDTGATDADGNTVVEKEYKVELVQIFSPGAYLVYGFGYDLPISLGFGGQYGPGLSKIDSSNTVTLDDPYWRWNFFLSVDIPLFNLTNKPKDKK